MTSRQTDAFRRRADEHRTEALRYRRNADALLVQGERVSAGALLYESAKRCINAVANQQGSNPVRTRSKFQFLRTIAAQGLTDFNLLAGWHESTNLHSHADQSHLTDGAFRVAWDTTQTFIAEMLAIYDQGQP